MGRAAVWCVVKVYSVQSIIRICLSSSQRRVSMTTMLLIDCRRASLAVLNVDDWTLSV